MSATDRAVRLRTQLSLRGKPVELWIKEATGESDLVLPGAQPQFLARGVSGGRSPPLAVAGNTANGGVACLLADGNLFTYHLSGNDLLTKKHLRLMPREKIVRVNFRTVEVMDQTTGSKWLCWPQKVWEKPV